MKPLFVGVSLFVLVGCDASERVNKMSWGEVRGRCSEQGYEALSEPERVWCGTRALIDATKNGGLVSYFYNSWANEYDNTVYALGKLEATEALKILTFFASLFGDKVPPDLDERNAIISSWKDGGSESEACEWVDSHLLPLMDQLEDQLNDYLLEHGIDPDYSYEP